MRPDPPASDRRPDGVGSGEGPSSRKPLLPAWLAGLKTADGLLVVDDQQRIVHWTEAAAQLLGYTAEQAVGRRCYEILASVDIEGHPVCREDCRVMANARRGRSTTAYDVVATRADGERVWVNTSTVLIPEAETPGATLVMHLVRPRPAATPEPRKHPRRVRPRRARSTQPLSRREIEVLALLSGGYTTPEVAGALGISKNTARNHIANIEMKLGARNRTEAVLIASEQRLI